MELANLIFISFCELWLMLVSSEYYLAKALATWNIQKIISFADYRYAPIHAFL
jgi:hypothetical protein